MSKQSFFAKKNIILSIVGVPIFLWATMTIVYPLIIGNGFDKYTGLQRQAAEDALLNEQLRHRHMFIELWVHVDNVRPITEEEKNNCDPTRIGHTPNDRRYYIVEYTFGIFGNPITEKKILLGCSLI
jgi:hypothetical protein